VNNMWHLKNLLGFSLFRGVSLLLALTFIVAPNLIYSNPSIAAPVKRTTTRSKWRIFSPVGSGFSVLMPSTPKADSETKDAINHGTGKMVKHTEYWFIAADNETAYIVSYSDADATSLVSSSIEGDLDIGLKLATFLTEKQAKGLIQRKQKLRLNGNPGIEIKWGYKDEESGQHLTYWKRIFCTRQPNNKIRTYEVVVISAKEHALQQTLKGFFNSFKLINKS
jgi:hypothetical protein